MIYFYSMKTKFMLSKKKSMYACSLIHLENNLKTLSKHINHNVNRVLSRIKGHVSDLLPYNKYEAFLFPSQLILRCSVSLELPTVFHNFPLQPEGQDSLSWNHYKWVEADCTRRKAIELALFPLHSSIWEN